jgi:hypothetical protein
MDITYYNILVPNENRPYNVFVKTSTHLDYDTALTQIIDALEEKELIDPDTAEDMEFGSLRVEREHIVKELVSKGFTCYNLTDYKF